MHRQHCLSFKGSRRKLIRSGKKFYVQAKTSFREEMINKYCMLYEFYAKILIISYKPLPIICILYGELELGVVGWFLFWKMPSHNNSIGFVSDHLYISYWQCINVV